MKPLERDFYDRETTLVARDLIGKYLVRRLGVHILYGKISEVEAYLPYNDPAAHNFIGMRARTRSLFKNAGHAYMHRMHGHNLLDVVTEGIGVPGSVLIRAIEPLGGSEQMMQFRNKDTSKGLTNGPGKVCQALQIDIHFDGYDMADPAAELFIATGVEIVKPSDILQSRRIGIQKAKELLLRFYL